MTVGAKMSEKLASTQQRKMFFGLCRQLGFRSEYGKKRAKKKFNLTTFKDISSSQLNTLIDALQERIRS